MDAVAGPSHASVGKSNTVLTRTNIHEVVSILSQDPLLLQRWSQFSDQLESYQHEKVQLFRGINNGTLHYYELFTQLLSNWVSRNSGKNVYDLCDVLEEIGCKATAEHLQQRFGEVSSVSITTPREANRFVRSNAGRNIQWPITYRVSSNATNFTGRGREIEQLTSCFNSSKSSLVLVCGFGGVGKTELCMKFINSEFLSDKSISLSRIWLHGESEETLRDSILHLAKELGVTNEGDANPAEYFEYITSLVLENCARLLVVIDNLDTMYEEADKVIKVLKTSRNAKKTFMIVTSRDRNVLHGAGITITLDVLLIEEARRMLMQSVGDLIDSDADKLSKLVHCFPLALQQAVAYIKQKRNHFRTQNYCVLDYIAEYEDKKSKMLDHRLNELEHSYSLTTLVTWDITISKMSHGAVEILKIIAYLDPDGINLKFLERIYSRLLGTNDFDEGLNMIDNFCLLKIEGGTISILRLIQDIMRSKIESNEHYYCKALFDCIFLACGKFEKGKSGPSESELAHLNSVCKFAWHREINTFKFFHEALLFLLQLGRIDCAVEYINLHMRNIRLRSDLDENQNRKKEFVEKVFLWCILNGGCSLTDEFPEMGLFTSSVNTFSLNLESLEAGLVISKTYFGETSGTTFRVKNQLVKKMFHLQFDKAIELCEELVSCQLDGTQTDIYFETVDYILGQLSETNYLERTSQLEKVLKMIVNFGEAHPDTRLRTLKSQARLLHLKGDYQQSLEAYSKLYHTALLAGDENSIIEFRSNVVEQKIAIADFSTITKEHIEREFLYAEYKNFSMAMLERILPFYEHILGQNHLFTVKVKNALAGELLNNENRERCIKLCDDVLDSTFDEEYKWAFVMHCEAKHILEYNYEKQIEILEMLLEKKRNLGENHSNVLRIKDLLAIKLELVGRLEKALRLFEQVGEYAKKACEWNQKDLTLCDVNVARVKLQLGDFSGMYILTGTLKQYKSCLSNELLEKMAEHANALQVAHEYQKSFELYTKLYDHFEEIGDEKKVRVYKLKVLTLAMALVDLDDVDKDKIVTQFIEAGYDNISIRGLGKILHCYEQILGKNHSLTAEVKLVISRKQKHADTLHIKGKFDKSLELYEQLLTYFKEQENENMVIKYKSKVLQLQIQLTNFDEVSAEEIEEKFSEADYDDFSMRGLNRVLICYEHVLGSNHILTIKVKVTVAKRLLIDDKNRSIELLEEVLDSNCEEQYADVFTLLCEARNIQNDYKQQINELQKILQDKQSKLGENHFCTLRILELLDRVKDKLNQLEASHQQKIPKISDLNLSKLFDISYVESCEIVYKEFGELDALSYDDLKRILTRYKRVFGENHKMTLLVKNSLARKLYWDGKLLESLELLEQVISAEIDDKEDAYDTMQLIGREFFVQEDYDKSKELLDRVLNFRIGHLGENNWDTYWTKEVLADVLERLGELERSWELRTEVQNYYEKNNDI